MAIPATAFHWHDQGVIPPGRLFFQDADWLLAIEVKNGDGSTFPASLCLVGEGQGIIRAQGSNGVSNAYVLAPEFTWTPFVSEFPGNIPPAGHVYAAAAIYTGTGGPTLWAPAGNRLVAVNVAGIDVTAAQSDAQRHPYFERWEAYLTSDARPHEPIAKLFEVTHAGEAAQA